MTADILEPSRVASCPLAPITVEQIRELIPALVSEVLETMFFCEAEPVTESEPDGEVSHEPAADEERTYGIVIDFQGSPSGQFWLRVSADAATSLAADFLGVDLDEVDEERSLQTALELGNMICGSVVSRVESQTAFALTAPRLIGDGDTMRADPPPFVTFAVAGGKVEVACSLS